MSIDGTTRNSSSKFKGYLCKVEGCKNLVFSTPSSSGLLCTSHEIQEKHKNASTVKPADAYSRPVTKLIHKTKLYTMAPEDKQYLKENVGLKRKRAPLVARKTGSVDPSLRAYANTRTQKPLASTSSSSFFSKSTAPERQPRQKDPILSANRLNSEGHRSSSSLSSPDKEHQQVSTAKLMRLRMAFPQLSPRMAEDVIIQHGGSVDEAILHISSTDMSTKSAAFPSTTLDDGKQNMLQKKTQNNLPPDYKSPPHRALLRLADLLNDEPMPIFRVPPPVDDSENESPSPTKHDTAQMGNSPDAELSPVLEKAWDHEDRDDSPGSQITQELRANANANSQVVSAEPEVPTSIVSFTSLAEVPEAEYNVPRLQLPDDSSRHLSKPDEEMQDAKMSGIIDQLAVKIHHSPLKSQTSTSASSPSHSVAQSFKSFTSGSPQNGRHISVEVEMADVLPKSAQEEPNNPDISDLIGVQPETELYDTGVLDYWIAKQRDAMDNDEEEFLSTKELLQSQRWGHIDPRVAWPTTKPPLSEEEREAKIKEIEARGGRKANFGKLLTAQVRKERAEKGWDIHQRCDTRDDEGVRELTMGMGELFAIEGLGNCVPGIRYHKDGVSELVMREREVEPEPGRRRRKPREYPVIGTRY